MTVIFSFYEEMKKEMWCTLINPRLVSGVQNGIDDYHVATSIYYFYTVINM